MRSLFTPDASDRLRSAMTAHRPRQGRAVWGWAGLLVVAAATGGWSRVASTQAGLVETRQAAQALAQRLNAQLPADLAPSPPPGSAMDVEPRAMSDDDVSALVRWQALLQELGLGDWQGRSLPDAASAPADRAAGGAVWQLEGAASYAQGVVLLEALARRFPRLVLLQVQVQHKPDTELLQWQLVLRWSAPVPALAQRWPVGEILTGAPGLNPFAGHRLVPPSPATAALDTRLGQAEVDVNHVLPRASLKDIRLIGVVIQDDERVAWVTWTAAPSDPAPPTGRVSSAPLPHRVRMGHTLGVEQTQVVAIEPQALVLRATRPGSSGPGRGPQQLLALADATGGGAAREDHRP